MFVNDNRSHAPNSQSKCITLNRSDGYFSRKNLDTQKIAKVMLVCHSTLNLIMMDILEILNLNLSNDPNIVWTPYKRRVLR